MDSAVPAYPRLLSVRKIWDRAPHNAFTDLIQYQGAWLCAFREGITHGGGDEGQVRLLMSPDGLSWTSQDLFVLPGADLRDPKLSIMPDGRLMLLVGRTVRHETERYLTHDTCAAFSKDAQDWTSLHQVLAGEWLWRVIWHQGVGYGVSYSFVDVRDHTKPWNLKLYRTSNGVLYQLVTALDVPGYPSETSLLMDESSNMRALVRREATEDSGAWLGHSAPPYTDWRWRSLKQQLDGPAWVAAPNGDVWAAGRMVDPSRPDQPAVTALCKIAQDTCQPVLILPSGGDNSYPGLVLQDKILWMSYYSSHDEKSAIYMAQIALEA